MKKIIEQIERDRDDLIIKWNGIILSINPNVWWENTGDCKNNKPVIKMRTS
jgi:hypothetical protein